MGRLCNVSRAFLNQRCDGEPAGSVRTSRLAPPLLVRVGGDTDARLNVAGVQSGVIEVI